MPGSLLSLESLASQCVCLQLRFSTWSPPSIALEYHLHHRPLQLQPCGQHRCGPHGCRRGVALLRPVRVGGAAIPHLLALCILLGSQINSLLPNWLLSFQRSPLQGGSPGWWGWQCWGPPPSSLRCCKCTPSCPVLLGPGPLGLAPDPPATAGLGPALPCCRGNCLCASPVSRGSGERAQPGRCRAGPSPLASLLVQSCGVAGAGERPAAPILSFRKHLGLK